MICAHSADAQLNLEVCIVELGLSDERRQQEPGHGGDVAVAGLTSGQAVPYRVHEHPAALHFGGSKTVTGAASSS